MKQVYYLVISLSIFNLFSNLTYGQTSIGGIINKYTKVVEVNTTDACDNKIEVASSADFSVGDKVLIIQMKGAIIDSTNTENFGQIIDYQEAGNYEFNFIRAIDGNEIMFQNILLKAYNPAAKVQLVYVPVYEDALVNSTLTAEKWNGETGGVLALDAENLTLSADINVTGLGFRGATSLSQDLAGCATSDAYFYPESSQEGAKKGEGIVLENSEFAQGRGAFGNGGGGGNHENSGGAGGSNYGAGGKGGRSWSGCVADGADIGGLGGHALAYNTTFQKVFLGGGGGAGHQDKGSNTSGSHGGGLVIIKANQVTGNFFTIFANGQNNMNNTLDDGSGGGGAGGSVLLEVTTYNTTLNVEIKGGVGASNVASVGCTGAGGGGGGGMIWFANTVLPSNVIFNANGASSGSHTSGSCLGFLHGATRGQNGTIVSNLVLPHSIPLDEIDYEVDLGEDITICPLDSLLLDATASGAVGYLWQDGSSNPTIWATTPQVHWVEVTFCDTVVYDSINVDATLDAINLGNDTLLCENETLRLQIIGDASEFSYLWQDSSTNNSFLVTEAGTYYVAVTACDTTVTDSIVVDYYSASNNIDIDLGDNRTICKEDNLILDATTVGATSYLWQDGSTDPMLTVSQSGNYTVEVTTPCTVGADTVKIRVKDCSNCIVRLPTAFSPNGDDINDNLAVYSDCQITNYNLQVFNRWGRVVFESNDPSVRWDGLFTRSTKQAPTGVYVWKISFEGIAQTGDTVNRVSRGNVTLIR